MTPTHNQRTDIHDMPQAMIGAVDPLPVANNETPDETIRRVAPSSALARLTWFRAVNVSYTTDVVGQKRKHGESTYASRVAPKRLPWRPRLIGASGPGRERYREC